MPLRRRRFPAFICHDRIGCNGAVDHCCFRITSSHTSPSRSLMLSRRRRLWGWALVRAHVLTARQHLHESSVPMLGRAGITWRQLCTVCAVCAGCPVCKSLRRDCKGPCLRSSCLGSLKRRRHIPNMWRLAARRVSSSIRDYHLHKTPQRQTCSKPKRENMKRNWVSAHTAGTILTCCCPVCW